jgi:hypothetical protein
MSVMFGPNREEEPKYANNISILAKEMRDEAPLNLRVESRTPSNSNDNINVNSGVVNALDLPFEYEHKEFVESGNLPHPGLGENVALKMALNPF